MSGPLRLPIQLPPQPKFILHQATPTTTLRMNVVDGDTWVLVGTAPETLFWKRVGEEDGERQQSEQEDHSSPL